MDRSEIPRPYLVADPSVAEAWYATYSSLIRDRIGNGSWIAARELALEWARGVSDWLNLREWRVWKQFKRAIAAAWFGEPERHIFQAGWTAAELLSYASTFTERDIRVSVFSESVACHAVSLCLPHHASDTWETRIRQADRRSEVEVFPESSTPTSICFRRFASAFNESVIYEAGTGQAMSVFESEQGCRAFAGVSLSQSGTLVWNLGNATYNKSEIAEIREKLRCLVRTHEWQLATRTFGISRRVGVEWLTIEGYYDPLKTPDVTIVDLDLPFDQAFMHQDAQ